MKQILNIFIFVFTIPILTFGQTNYKDELGRKQGLHIDTLKYGEIYERTYTNDTLHGLFRKLSKNGTIIETGYYKNGLKDSLWVTFNKYGKIAWETAWETGYYKNGLKDSLWKETYIDKSWGIGYCKNGKMDSLWTEFYQNGNIKSKIEYSNGGYFGQRYYFSIDGDTLFPRFTAPKLINDTLITNDENDTLIINNTDLKVYLLFDSKDSLNRFFCHGWASVYSICLNDYLTICTEYVNFKVTPISIKIYDQIDTICNNKLKVNWFGTNMRGKELKNGDYKSIYEFGEKRFKSRFGKIIVNRQQGCMDTGRNPIKIVRKGKILLFNEIGNLIFFEFDGDNDGKKELYLLNYFSCGGRLEFYKIDDK